MTPIIICTYSGYEGDSIQVYLTDASLTRIRRYCAVMGYELIAYGGNVYRDAETLLRGDMALEARDHRRRARECRAKNAGKTIDEIMRELAVHFEPTETKLWSRFERIPAPQTLMFEWNATLEYGR